MISTLAYSVRLVGVKTGRLAITLAIFNVLALSSRFSNALQAPFLAKFVENDIPQIAHTEVIYYFMFLIISASLGTLTGGLLTPTFQRVLTKLVYRFNIDKSVPKLLYHSFSKIGIKQLKASIHIPKKENINQIKEFHKMPRRIIVLNSFVVALLTVGSFAALYAAALSPDIRLTASTLAPLITGFATITLIMFIDPYFSYLTDEIIDGNKSIAIFYKSVLWLVISRFVGTLLALGLLIPCAYFIIWIASVI